jgi:hypothetical protein
VKNLIYYLPIGLLFSYIGFCFYRPPQVSDSIIVVAIAALYGFLMYIKSFKEITPSNIPKDEKDLLNQIKQLKLKREIHGLQYDLARFNKVQKEQLDGKTTFKF